MRDIYDLIRKKEAEILRLQKELEALRIVAPMLSEEEAAKSAAVTKVEARAEVRSEPRPEVREEMFRPVAAPIEPPAVTAMAASAGVTAEPQVLPPAGQRPLELPVNGAAKVRRAEDDAGKEPAPAVTRLRSWP